MKSIWPKARTGVLFLVFFALGNVSHVRAQVDLLVTSFSGDSVEQFNGETGESLGSFIAAGSGGLTNAAGVAVGPDSNVYVTSWGSNEILRFDGSTGAFIDVFASGDNLFRPNNIVLNGDYFYVTQTASGSNGFVRRYDAVTGDLVDDFLDIDFGDGLLFEPDAVLVSNFGGGVNRFSLTDGAFIEEFIPSGAGGLSNPTALLKQDDGSFLVSSFGTDSVKQYASDGTYIDDVITGLSQPEGLVIGPDGSLYAGSFGTGVINRYDADTYQFIDEFASVGGNTNFFTFRNTAVPEPSSVSLLATIAAMGLFRRGRRSS